MKFSKIDKNDIDMTKYKAQTIVKRTSTACNMMYDNIAIMTDADVDG